MNFICRDNGFAELYNVCILDAYDAVQQQCSKSTRKMASTDIKKMLKATRNVRCNNFVTILLRLLHLEHAPKDISFRNDVASHSICITYFYTIIWLALFRVIL